MLYETDKYTHSQNKIQNRITCQKHKKEKKYMRSGTYMRWETTKNIFGKYDINVATKKKRLFLNK